MVEVALTCPFKPGDRVRRISVAGIGNYNGMGIGDVDVVVAISNTLKFGGRTYSSVTLEKYGTGHADYCLELVPVDTPKTDQELADEYRRGQNICWDARRELESRGFVTKWNGKPKPALIPANKIVECEFEKVTTTTVVEKV
jgi:hypothetical protein